MYPPVIQKLIDLFSKFPTVGPRTAARFVFYLTKLPQDELEKFLDSIINLRKAIRVCSFCFNPFDTSTAPEESFCPICQNASRNRTLLCVVEKESDLTAIEEIKRYKGLYFILGGTLSGLKKEDVKKLRVKELKERIKEPQKFGLNADFKEIIIATNPTTEGEVTALLIERELKPFNIKITRLGRGLPVGGELEYADEDTLGSAFEGRK